MGYEYWFTPGDELQERRLPSNKLTLNEPNGVPFDVAISRNGRSMWPI